MKPWIKKIIIWKLSVVSRLIVWRYKPYIIAVAGSVGKTSTKDAIFHVLNNAGFPVRKSQKSYNSEFGLPLTVIGAENPWGKVSGWVAIIARGLWLVIIKDHSYPKYLVLETGVGKLFDMDHITAIIKPDISVLTNLPDTPVHVEFFSSREELWREEAKLCVATKPEGFCICNASDANSRAIIAQVLGPTAQQKVAWFGSDANSEVVLSSYEYTVNSQNLPCLSATFLVRGMPYQATYEHMLAPYAFDSFLPAFCIASRLGLDITKAVESLAQFVPPPGRVRAFAAKNNSVVIDDTYNASPVATHKALEVLAAIPNAQRRIAILGDMLELGEYTDEAHQKVGIDAVQKADIFVAVGLRMKTAFDAAQVFAKEYAMNTDIRYCMHPEEVFAFVEHDIRDNDLVLVKGSQGMRMERIVKMLLRDESDAMSLARQDLEWQKRLPNK